MPVSNPPADDAGLPPNRLAEASSPYLRQHALNPVRWQPWDARSIELARRLDRPIFLSVGYATCYWCHVMERESFESVPMADLLNTWFVPIKVDREERPDVDHLFMQAVQLLNQGQGGWPMSVFVEPGGLRPFIAGTYFPPEDRWGRPGFATVLQQVAAYWRDHRPDVLGQAARVAERIASFARPTPAEGPLDRSTCDRGIDQLMAVHDPVHGGFGGGPGRPKFPTPVNLELLLAAGGERPEIDAAVRRTLDAMALGGIHDHVGGGFHRYSVDERWDVPHFEKMLYDNGQLLGLYARSVARTGDPLHRAAAEGIVTWARREMRLPGGGFASALDAEVDHREGLNHLWTDEEIALVLASAGRAEEIPRVRRMYDLERGPNFRDPHHPGEPPRSVLRLTARPERLAEAFGQDAAAFGAWKRQIDALLLAARDRRPAPLRDGKVLAGWNGLMIAGLAAAGRHLALPEAVEDAARAARFVLEHLRTPDGRLARAWMDGPSEVPAALEDHAMLAGGLLALASVTGEPAWRTEAESLLREARGRYRDVAGCWWDCDAGRADLFTRSVDRHDGAVPSGTAAVAGAMLDAAEAAVIAGEVSAAAGWRSDAADAVASVAGDLSERPGGSPAITLVLHRLLQSHPGAIEAAMAAEADDPVHASLELGGTAEAGGATATLHLQLDAGWTLIGRSAGGVDAAGLQPLGVAIEGGDGVAVDAALPAGRLEDGPLGPVHLFEGRIAIPLTLQRTGPTVGRPHLALRVQACREGACRKPRVLRLDLPPLPWPAASPAAD